MFFFYFIFFLLNYSKENDNCISFNNNNECISCNNGYYLDNKLNTCLKCSENCLSCFSNNYCLKCEDNFILLSKICGINCEINNDNNKNFINDCKLCSKDNKKCLKCKSFCKWNGKECNCKEKYIVITIIISFSLFIIIVLILCLTIENFGKKCKLLYLLMDFDIFNNSSMINNNPNINEIKFNNLNNLNKEKKKKNKKDYKYKKLPKKSHLTTISEEIEMVYEEDNSTKTSIKEICDFCLIEEGKFKLNCGCTLCEKDYKKLNEKNNKCPVCGKKNEN
jgi:hypothetical protein